MSNKNKNYGNYYKNPLVEIEDMPDTVNPQVPEVKEDPVVEETPVNAPAPEKKAIVKGASRVNMRVKANKDSTILSVIPENTEVKIIDDSNEYWFRIEADNKIGFMMSKFLKRV